MNKLKLYIKGEVVDASSISPKSGDILVRLLRKEERDGGDFVRTKPPTRIYEVVLSNAPEIEVGDFVVIGRQMYELHDDAGSQFVVTEAARIYLLIKK